MTIAFMTAFSALIICTIIGVKYHQLSTDANTNTEDRTTFIIGAMIFLVLLNAAVIVLIIDKVNHIIEMAP